MITTKIIKIILENQIEIEYYHYYFLFFSLFLHAVLMIIFIELFSRGRTKLVLERACSDAIVSSGDLVTLATGTESRMYLSVCRACVRVITSASYSCFQILVSALVPQTATWTNGCGIQA